MRPTHVEIASSAYHPVTKARAEPVDQLYVLIEISNDGHASWHPVRRADEPVQDLPKVLTNMFVRLFDLVGFGVGIAGQESPVLDHTDVLPLPRLWKAKVL
jgi:hypothetical protein